MREEVVPDAEAGGQGEGRGEGRDAGRDEEGPDILLGDAGTTIIGGRGGGRKAGPYQVGPGATIVLSGSASADLFRSNDAQ